MDAAAEREERVRQLLLRTGDQRRRDLLPGPRLQRASDRPADGQGPMDEELTTPPTRGRTALVVAGGRVYGATTNAAFALDEQTGKQLWSVTLVRNEHEGIDMTPGYHDGVVYVSTVPGNTTQFYKGEGVGILWALESSTGQRSCGISTRCRKTCGRRKTWTSTPAVGCGTRRRLTNTGSCTSAPATRARSRARAHFPGDRAGRGRTCTRTRSSSSTRARANCSGTTS